MHGWDPVVLARAQFALTIGFHIVFPAFSIGLASYLAVLEGLWLATGRQVYLDLFRYWVKIFSLGFAMGGERTRDRGRHAGAPLAAPALSHRSPTGSTPARDQ